MDLALMNNSKDFELSVLPIKPRLDLMAMRLTSNNTQNAEDLVQETLIKAFVNWHQYDENTNLPGWLFMILKNTYYYNFNKAKRRGERLVGELQDWDTYNASQHVSGGNLSAEDSSLEDWGLADPKLIEAVSNLKEKLKIPFYLRLEGYKYKEIADILDIPLGTALSRVDRARERIKQELETVL